MNMPNSSSLLLNHHLVAGVTTQLSGGTITYTTRDCTELADRKGHRFRRPRRRLPREDGRSNAKKCCFDQKGGTVAPSHPAARMGTSVGMFPMGRRRRSEEIRMAPGGS
jgi:hypothetical protein